MCKATNQEVVIRTQQVEQEPKAEQEVVKLRVTKESACCEPSCDPSTCGR